MELQNWLHPAISRRTAVQAGAVGICGLGMNHLAGIRSAASAEPTTAGTGKAKACIYIFLSGGLAQQDSFDLKPSAPDSVRGEFSPIHTRTPGIEICEHLPMHAAIADKFALIRSVTHGFAGHDGAHKRVLTGRVPKSPTGFVNDAPGVGSIVSRMRESRSRDSLVFTSGQRAGTNVEADSQGSAYLGQA